MLFRSERGVYPLPDAHSPSLRQAVFAALREAGYPARDYAFCGLIAAYSQAGDVRGALGVRSRMRAASASPSVHVYNALIAACERAHMWCAARSSDTHGICGTCRVSVVHSTARR